MSALALSALGAFARDARADTKDSANAQALFDAGQAAMDQKDYATACGKFEESETLEPAPGTLYFWAQCEEQRGHVATAWGLYHELDQKLPDSDPRKPGVVDRVAALAPRVPHVVIRLAPGTPDGATVLRDEKAIGPASLGTSLPIDPGHHVFAVDAPDRLHEETPFDIGEGESKELALEAGAPAPKKPPKGETKHGGFRVPFGITLGSVGVLAMGAGIVTGVIAKSHYDDSGTHCDRKDQCDSKGIQIRDDARTIGTAGTAVFIAGAVVAGTGLIVWLSAPRAEGGLASGPTVRMAIQPGGVTLRTDWSGGP